jgi:aryl-alcohol dehydrogenase
MLEGDGGQMKIKAAVVYEKNAPFEIKEVELAEPKDDEILTRMAGCGVCHTDESVRRQELPVPLPIVLGHEGSGVVEKVGRNVTHVKPGDHVVFSPVSCGECEYCLSGHPSACVKLGPGNFAGTYLDGTRRLKDENGKEISAFFSQSAFATYAVTHKRNTIKLDDEGIDLALLGPLSCGIQTGAGTVLNVLKPEAGESIAVFGCGGVGLSAVMAAKIAGCTQIIGIDAVPKRLEIAKELGCTDVINGKEAEDLTQEITRVSNGGVHHSFDTTGVPVLVEAAIKSLRKMGACALAATMGDRQYSIQYGFMVQAKAAKIIGIQEGDSNFPLFLPKLVDFYKKGMFPFDKMIKFYSLDDIEKAFADSLSGETIKPVSRF